METLDADVKKSNMDETSNDYDHLLANNRTSQQAHCMSASIFFDSALGTQKTKIVTLEIKPDTKLHYQHPCQFPRIYEETLKREVEMLI